ncbi:MAG: undecaprenyl-phosphate glucose phosphotransferase [Burkholderiales bacterium]|nr:undecaprenyl-phosphate glucose phosphotransferase [Burkholderiales bacterium]
MSVLAAQFKAVGTEMPLAAFVRVALAPSACVLSLGACMALFGEPFSPLYGSLAAVVFLVALRVFGELPLTNQRSLFMPGGAILPNWITVIGVLLFLAFVTKTSDLYSRKLLSAWFAVTPFALYGAQALARRLLHRFVASGVMVRTKVIVGVTEIGCELAREIDVDPCRGLMKGFFDDRAPERLARMYPCEIVGGIDDVARYVKQHGINVVYITLPVAGNPKIARMLDELRDTTASVYFVPNALRFDLIQARLEHVGNVPAIAVCETPFYGLNGALKRAADVLFAGMALLALWPLMLAIAIGVRFTPGPVLFKQRRYGLDGKEIKVYKFRTMSVCEDGTHVLQARRNDRRVTDFGAFLRRTSLDELPQLINVLAGDMSIVGPRPHAVAHNEQYRRLIDGYMIRHKVRPGITGWAQVNGFRGETETVDKMKRRIEYDLDYLRHWSLSLDLWIMLKTVLVVLKDRSAY